MSIITEKLANMCKEAGITPGMLRKVVGRNVMDVAKAGIRGGKQGLRNSLEPALANMRSAYKLTGRELAATKGLGNPGIMKNIVRSAKSNASLGRNTLLNRLSPEMADIYKTTAAKLDKTYYGIKRGINPFTKF